MNIQRKKVKLRHGALRLLEGVRESTLYSKSRVVRIVTPVYPAVQITTMGNLISQIHQYTDS